MNGNIKVLLLGGTGAIGRYLCESLVKNGFDVYVTSRSPHEDINNLHYIQGNAKNFEFLLSVLKNQRWDVIFDFMVYQEEQFRNRYKHFLKSCKQYFFISSQRVYALPDENGYVNEETKRKVDCEEEYEYWSKDKYGFIKGLEENILFKSDYSNWTILRLSMTFAPNRFQFGPLDNFDVVRAVRGQCSALSDSLAEKFTTLTFGKDTANLIVPLVMNKEALSNVYNVGTEVYYTWKEIADIYHRVFGLNYKIIPESDYLIATKSEKNMIDRTLDRKIDSSKLHNVGSNKNYRCMSLEDGLKEAWTISDKKRYLNGVGALDAHTLIDLYTDTTTNVDNLHDSIKTKYVIMRKRMESVALNPIKMNDVYFVTESSEFWNIRYEDKGVLIHRADNHILNNESKWCSFYPMFEIKAGKKYLFSVELVSNCRTKFALFLHGYEYNYEALCRLPLDNGFNRFVISFSPEKTARFAAITALDFKNMDIELLIKDIRIEEIS